MFALVRINTLCRHSRWENLLCGLSLGEGWNGACRSVSVYVTIYDFTTIKKQKRIPYFQWMFDIIYVYVKQCNVLYHFFYVITTKLYIKEFHCCDIRIVTEENGNEWKTNNSVSYRFSWWISGPFVCPFKSFHFIACDKPISVERAVDSREK